MKKNSKSGNNIEINKKDFQIYKNYDIISLKWSKR